MTVHAGPGDPHRSRAPRWDAPEPSRAGRGARSGPKPGLSVDAIVSAAIAVADAEGMAAFSMRAVGERLGRTAMALYTYVPGKDELLALMHDRALAELPPPAPRSDDWRAAATDWAEQLYACYLRHPWVLRLPPARPALGPAELAALESLLSALAPAALAPARLRGAVAALRQYVRGAAAATADASGAQLDRFSPEFAERFPLLTALRRDPGGASGNEDGDEAGEAFRAGLAVLLDGIAAS
ncbi:TetR/AcrR family transcriptional regulator [Streptomyces sp. Y1]|uniref:TetR/AcrR family transcriptional regulator n=1 Tax=Streptomyces sp. Y1 TaxID=3238634 RepID=A0AB39TUE8_9ACTN